MHDGHGHLQPLSDVQYDAYKEIMSMARSLPQWINHRLFQKNLIEGRTNDWKCRAGARYLYLCEDGLVHWCSQQRGYPGVPVEDYTVEDIRREYLTEKSCAPMCTVNCVHQSSALDGWRGKQTISDPTNGATPTPQLVQIEGIDQNQRVL